MHWICTFPEKQVKCVKCRLSSSPRFSRANRPIPLRHGRESKFRRFYCNFPYFKMTENRGFNRIKKCWKFLLVPKHLGTIALLGSICYDTLAFFLYADCCLPVIYVTKWNHPRQKNWQTISGRPLNRTYLNLTGWMTKPNPSPYERYCNWRRSGVTNCWLCT